MKNILSISAITIVLLASCKPKKTDEAIAPIAPAGPTYTIPTSYSFQIVNYSGQTTRLAMLEEMIDYLKTGREAGTTLSAAKLKNMFSNTGSPFTDAALNTSGKQLENKFFVIDVPLVKTYMDSLEVASKKASNIITSKTDATRKYLLNTNGFDYTEMIEKLTMGAVLYYQTVESYISSAGVGSGVDNITSVAGEGTAMEHHWDEGFGYLGIPTDFPKNNTNLLFWGEYIDEVGGGVLNNKTTLMNAFLKGRAAIVNKDYTTRDQQITIIQNEFERLVAACAIHELNEAKDNISDDAIRNHVVSEGRGFIMALKYKSNSKISQTQISSLINTLGTNFNTITIADINKVIDDLATIYGMQSIKANL